MRTAASRRPQNQFEHLVLATIGKFHRLDGVVTNNVILPHPMRSLPNEHDILVLLAGRVVTIDAKELWPGDYRDTAGGWEYLKDQHWNRIEGFSHPIEIAFKKGKVAETFVRSQLGTGTAIPEVLSCIVVPDGCDVSKLGIMSGGRTPLGARLLIVRLCELEDALLADADAFRQRRPLPDELAAALRVEHLSDADPTACLLSDELEVLELLEVRRRPISRTVYLGKQHRPRERRVRIEVCPYSTDDARTVESLMRAHRSHLVALQEAAIPGVIRLYDHRVAPTATVFVHEFFSRQSLTDHIQRDSLSWTVARCLAEKLVATLDALHSSGVVHRYLDPSSVLVAGHPPSDIRVRDFFGARSLDVSTIGQDPAASPYDPPERGPDATPHPSMDWFSVGRCVRAMLTCDPFGWPGGDVPSALQSCLAALEDVPSKREEGWRRLRRLVMEE